MIKIDKLTRKSIDNVVITSTFDNGSIHTIIFK